MTDHLVLLSGGLDSTTALALCARVGKVRAAVSVHYGQRHSRELDAAAAIAAHYRVQHLVLDLRSWGSLLSGSALTDARVEVPHGHYADESMRTTVVPNRNAVLLNAAAGIADAMGCSAVVTAVHAGDHPVYPDCRPEFIQAIDHTARLATDGRVGVAAPFLHETKDHIAALAVELGVPVELTWSCYEGRDQHCGRCGTCVERIEALASTGAGDPTSYEVAA